MIVGRRRVQGLVAAHLGVAEGALVSLLALGGLVGCTEAQRSPAPENPPPTPPVTATAAASTTLAKDVGKPVTAPPATAMAPATTCQSDKDCAAGNMMCVTYPDRPDSGTCVPHPFLGRPLMVDGEAHVASYICSPTVSSKVSSATDVDALLDAAREEHASIAAFARTVSELLALGAPASLLFETQAALGDEIRHTEMTLDRIARATGECPVLGPLPAAVAPLRSGDSAARELLRDVFRGGAVGETIAAAHAEDLRARAENAGDAAAHAFYETLVIDESRHAALAFKTLRWLVATFPDLAATLAEEKVRFIESESPETRLLVGPLLDLSLAPSPAPNA